VNDRVILIVIILLVREFSPLLGTHMGIILYRRLTAEAREYLGLPAPDGTRSERLELRSWQNAANYAFHQVEAPLDPYPETPHYTLLDRAEREEIQSRQDPAFIAARRRRLNWYSNTMLEMTVQLMPRNIRRRVKKFTKIGGDQTDVPAASRRGRSKLDKDGRETDPNRKVLEMNAGWYVKSVDKRDKDGHPTGESDVSYVWGWAANIVKLVPNSRTDAVEYPNIAIGYSMAIPNKNLDGDTIDILESLNDRNYTPGTFTADRAYFAGLSTETFHARVRELGWGVVTDYKSDQLGVKGGKAGALQVEGRHYCAATPKALLNASVDAEAHVIDEATYDKRLQERTAFELRPKEKADSRGHVPMMCPAVGPNATVECPLRELHPKASKKKTRPRVLERDLPEMPDRICTQSSVSFSPEDGLKYAQQHRFKTMEWKEVYRTARNADESYHQYVKSSSHEGLRLSARRRIRGFAAQQILTTAQLVSANIRKIVSFMDAEAERVRKAQTEKVKSGTPKRSVRKRDREGSAYRSYWPVKELPALPGTDPPQRL
jgi:hypothetical protein